MAQHFAAGATALKGRGLSSNVGAHLPMVTLVLLPGMDGTGDLFSQFIEALSPGTESIVVRYPTTGALGYAELEQIARSKLPTDRPFVILAESFSGPIGVLLAASSPQGLLGLVLCCSFVVAPRFVPKPLVSLVRLLPVGHRVASIACRLALGRFYTAARAQALLTVLGRVAPKALRARIRAVLAVDVTTAISRVRVPVLYLRALEDRVVPESASRLLLRRLPSAEVVEFAAPHFLLQVEPAAAARGVEHFVEGLARGL